MGYRCHKSHGMEEGKDGDGNKEKGRVGEKAMGRVKGENGSVVEYF